MMVDEQAKGGQISEMVRKVNEHMTGLTNISPHVLSDYESAKLREGKAEFIIDRILRKGFRRRADSNRRAKVAAKVGRCVAEDLPLGFTVPFGGYKHFWNPSHPTPDWAEVIHFRQMVRYFQPILAVHKPGIELEYVSEDLIVPRMDNYPDAAIEAYCGNFTQLVAWYDRFVPSNLKMTFWRLGDRYDRRAIVSRVEEALPARIAAFHDLSPERQSHELRRSVRSVFWNGRYDLTGLDAEEKHARVIEARVMEKAFSDIAFGADFAGAYYDDGNRLCTCFSFGMSTDNDVRCFLTVQSSPGSIVDHWIGRGVIYELPNGLRSTIVSRLQYQELVHRIVVVPVDNPPLDHINYRSIDLIRQQ
jgi:hypothetical protein